MSNYDFSLFPHWIELIKFLLCPLKIKAQMKINFILLILHLFFNCIVEMYKISNISRKQFIMDVSKWNVSKIFIVFFPTYLARNIWWHCKTWSMFVSQFLSNSHQTWHTCRIEYELCGSHRSVMTFLRNFTSSLSIVFPSDCLQIL